MKNGPEKLPSEMEYARLDAAWQKLVRERDDAVLILRQAAGMCEGGYVIRIVRDPLDPDRFVIKPVSVTR